MLSKNNFNYQFSHDYKILGTPLAVCLRYITIIISRKWIYSYAK